MHKSSYALDSIVPEPSNKVIWRDSTKVIFILDWHVPAGIENGPPRWEASTLEKSYLNSLMIAFQNINIWPFVLEPVTHLKYR